MKRAKPWPRQRKNSILDSIEDHGKESPLTWRQCIIIVAVIAWLMLIASFFVQKADAAERSVKSLNKEEVLRLNECVHRAYIKVYDEYKGMTPVNKYLTFNYLVRMCYKKLDTRPDVGKDKHIF